MGPLMVSLLARNDREASGDRLVRSKGTSRYEAEG
ncbi:hypothetical protein MBRA_01396 [Methylobacterium brachiatum]|nr:hypothetical protein MBRA_01396 [Methylobacterium brachiatum]